MSNSKRKEILETKRLLAKSTQEYQYEHDHKDKDRLVVKPVRDANRFVSLKPFQDKDSTYVCDECGAVFDGNYMSKEQTEELIYHLRSALHLTKLFVQLDETEQEEMMKLFYSVDQLEMFFSGVYAQMVKELSNNNKGNNKKNGVSKGMFGINGMYGGR